MVSEFLNKQFGPHIIKELKKPQGILILNKDLSPETLSKFLGFRKKIIAVGDRTVTKLISFGIVPDISVIDGYERRKKQYGLSIKEALVSTIPYNKLVLMTAQNPSGTISFDSITKIKKSLKIKNRVVLEISGEEDLLVLPYILLAQYGSVILYGQPLRGMVVVDVTTAIREKTKRLIGVLDSD